MPERARLRRKLLQLGRNERRRIAGWLALLAAAPEPDLPSPFTRVFEASISDQWQARLEEMREWREAVSEAGPEKIIIIGGAGR